LVWEKLVCCESQLLRVMDANEDDDLSMQIGWNQLFQQFVSDLFSDTEEKHPPVVTIDELTKNGSGIGSILQSLRKAIDFVRSKYARNITP
jgi:hypothetical protein